MEEESQPIFKFDKSHLNLQDFITNISNSEILEKLSGKESIEMSVCSKTPSPVVSVSNSNSRQELDG